jgi:hypothetical protein
VAVPGLEPGPLRLGDEIDQRGQLPRLRPERAHRLRRGIAVPEAVAEQHPAADGQVRADGLQRGHQPSERVGGSDAEHHVERAARPRRGVGLLEAHAVSDL